MIKLGDNRYIIGFDNGYQYGKTANSMFENGVSALGNVEASVIEHSLKYDNQYYKVGEGRAVIKENKTSDENARLLTMVAIAKELLVEKVYKAEIVLAVGLPFSDYGREKKELLEYYNRKPELVFEYEGEVYKITISRTFVFPQCYSAIAPRLGNMRDDYIVVDIGSKTTDVIYLKKGIPIESKSITIEKAMVKWIRQIQGSLQIQFGKNIEEDELLKVILNKSSRMPKEYREHINEAMKGLVDELLWELEEREYNLDYANIIFVGGGATAVKRYMEFKPNVAYDSDIRVNARGYEYLANQIMRRKVM